MADKEKISALMDGKLVDKALISKLYQDQFSLKTWNNYHLTGDVMVGDSPQTVEWNIADSVALALEKEQAYSKVPSKSVTEILSSAEQPDPVKARLKLHAWFNQFRQFAVAACVSLVIILGVQQFNSQLS